MFARLFPPAFAKSYDEDLLCTINQYIEKHKDSWLHRSGVDGAKKLQGFITEQLCELDHLSSEQLMWRMYSYIRMDKGIGMLGSSVTLRQDILENMCKYLSVSQQKIDQVVRGMMEQEVQVWQAAAASGGTYYVVDKQVMINRAMLILVNNKLSHVDVIAKKVDNWSKCYLSLLDSIDNYKNAAKKRWFKREGIERADELQELASKQWVQTEGLNDNQLLTRMLELVAMPVGYGEGPLGTSRELRAEIVKGMCRFLRLDEKEIQKEIAMDAASVLTQRVSPFGPVANTYDEVAASLKIRMRYIKPAIEEKIHADDNSAYQEAAIACRETRDIVFGI